jgi:hypothetical protein
VSQRKSDTLCSAKPAKCETGEKLFILEEAMKRQTDNLYQIYHEFFEWQCFSEEENGAITNCFDTQSQEFLSKPDEWIAKHKDCEDHATTQVYRMFSHYHKLFDPRGFRRCEFCCWDMKHNAAKIDERFPDFPQVKKMLEGLDDHNWFLVMFEKDGSVIGIAKMGQEIDEHTNKLEDIWIQRGYESDFGPTLIDRILKVRNVQCVTKNRALAKLLISHGREVTITLEANK